MPPCVHELMPLGPGDGRCARDTATSRPLPGLLRGRRLREGRSGGEQCEDCGADLLGDRFGGGRVELAVEVQERQAVHECPHRGPQRLRAGLGGRAARCGCRSTTPAARCRPGCRSSYGAVRGGRRAGSTQQPFRPSQRQDLRVDRGYGRPLRGHGTPRRAGGLRRCGDPRRARPSAVAVPLPAGQQAHRCLGRVAGEPGPAAAGRRPCRTRRRLPVLRGRREAQFRRLPARWLRRRRCAAGHRDARPARRRPRRTVRRELREPGDARPPHRAPC